MSNKIQILQVNSRDISFFNKKDEEYISLTDIARTKNPNDPKDVVKNWFRNRSTVEFLGLWENINNPNFKGVEFDPLLRESGSNSFTLSPTKWISKTSAIGIISKTGRGGGTFAQKDIAFDNNGHFLTNSAYFISGENLKYLVAVLNSSVSDYYFFQITAKIAGGRKRYTKQYVEQIPIPQINNKRQIPYKLLVDYLIWSKAQSNELIFNFFEQLLDAIVFELYFPEELKAANKEILKHLGNLKPLTDEMSEEEKLSIIQSEFERLYNPNHPVRNAMETLDNIEEVRIIKESLNH